MDQFTDGLAALGVHAMVKEHPVQLQEFFVSSDCHVLKAGKLNSQCFLNIFYK